MMVAVAVCALPMLLIRAIRDARDARERTDCQNCLRQIGLGLVQYATEFGTFPCAAIPNETLPVERRLSWMTAISSSFDYADLHNMFDRTMPWDSPVNSRCATVPCRVLQCPSVRGRMPYGPTQFVGITGIGRDSPWLPTGHPRAGVFGFDRVTRFRDMKDGAGTTLLIVETAELNGNWTAGGDAAVRPVDPARRPYIGQGRPFGGLHRAGVNACFADGSVRFLGESIDPKVFEALSTVAGSETLPPDWKR